MAQGKAEKKVTLGVDYFDWNRYNLTNTTLLVNWVASFKQDANLFFKADEETKQLIIITPVGENLPVQPGDVIIRDVEGNYFCMDPQSFANTYDITEEIEEPEKPKK